MSRTIKKTVTYSVMHMTVAFIVALAISGNWLLALSISLIEPIVQTIAYFFHERAWERLNMRNSKKWNIIES
jgi:uncharacterized membrane protein